MNAREMANGLMQSLTTLPAAQSTLAAVFPVEAFQYRVETFGAKETVIPASLLARALAAYSNEKAKRRIAEEQVATLKKENQMLWTAIANRDEETK